jgi:S-adenosylmethionine synthetase
MSSIVITGASGLLGRAVLDACRGVPSWQVHGTVLSRVRNGLDRVDLCDARAVREFLEARQPRIIVHCAAERRPDASEDAPDATVRLNVEATARLAKWAAANSAWLVFLSTDYVFDGVKPPYAVDAPTNPLNLYGRSKRDGELAVWAETSDAAVLRVPVLYGTVERLDESVVTDLARRIRDARGAAVTLENWATRYPTGVDDLAVVLRQMIERRLEHSDFRGTFHWSGDEPFTKFGMGQVMARVLGIDPAVLVPDDRPPGGAPRPRDCHLDCSELERLGIGQRTPFVPAITRILQPWLKTEA